MTILELRAKTAQLIPVGTVFDNPGGGISTIVNYTDNNILYRRGTAVIYFSFKDIFAAYIKFRNQRVATTDLKKFRPSVFDSSARPAGHSCNCTMFFMLLGHLDLAEEIEGFGVKGAPFSVKLKNKTTI